MRLSLTTLLAAAAILTATLAAQGRPDPAAHKAAMQKLAYLAGDWAGEATITNAQGEQIKVTQTEEIRYKLDGTVLLIEGTGRDAAGKVVFNALGAVSFEPATGTYKIRAWNSGNFVETELKLQDKGFDWGFKSGPVTMSNRMMIDEQGRWSETSEAVMGNGMKVHSVRMLLSRKP